MEHVLRAAADLSLNVMAINDWPPKAAHSTDDDTASCISSDSNASDTTQMRGMGSSPCRPGRQGHQQRDDDLTLALARESSTEIIVSEGGAERVMIVRRKEQYRRSPRLTRVFRPADGFEFADSSATLILTKLGREIRLSPRKLAEIRLDEVEALMAAFSARLGACLLAGQHASDPNLLDFTRSLVDEVTAMIAVVESKQPLFATLLQKKKDGHAKQDGTGWPTIVEALELSTSQVQKLVEMRGRQSMIQRHLMAERAKTLAIAQKSELEAPLDDSPPLTSTLCLVNKARSQEELLCKLTTNLERSCHAVGTLRQEVLRKVLHPLQAATVFVACSPFLPDVLALLEAVNYQFPSVQPEERFGRTRNRPSMPGHLHMEPFRPLGPLPPCPRFLRIGETPLIGEAPIRTVNLSSSSSCSSLLQEPVRTPATWSAQSRVLDDAYPNISSVTIAGLYQTKETTNRGSRLELRSLALSGDSRPSLARVGSRSDLHGPATPLA